jgi:hypothetical protein
MRNRSPIVLNCFSRGGSNILWNVLLSHPGVCSPIQETLEIFRLDGQGVRWQGVKAAWLTGQPSFFNQWYFRTRRPISGRAHNYIDEVLFEWKMKTLEDEEMRFKSREAQYTPAEVEQARLVLKNNNGTIFLSDILAELYPGLVFFGLLREPLSLYESHKRHKTPVGVSPQRFAAFYRTMAQKMLADAERWDFYHILRFEDLLRDPLSAIQQIFALAGLDVAGVLQMRFKAKPHMQADGSHATPFREGRHYWFEMDEIQRILEPQVNQFQVFRLPVQEVEDVKKLTREICAQIGYAEA